MNAMNFCDGGVSDIQLWYDFDYLFFDQTRIAVVVLFTNTIVFQIESVDFRDDVR